MADIKKIIKDLQDGFGTTEEDKGAVLALFKGLIFSDDKLAKEYMKKLDKATTEISKEMSEDKDDKKKKESYNRVREAKNIGAISYYKTDGAIQVTFPSEQEYITIRNARLTYDDFMDFVESLSNSEVYDSGEDKGMEYTYVQRSGIIKLEKFFDSNIDEFEEM